MDAHAVGWSDEELLVALANTGHEGADELADPVALVAWWASLRGRAAATSSSDAGLDALRELRSTVQEAALHHNVGDAGATGRVSTGAAGARVPTSVADLTLRAQLTDGQVSLVPQRSGDLAAEVAAVAVVALLRATGRPTWTRVKGCRGTDCGWVFIDASRNSSRRWCDMAGCGNRAKTATFRARHRLPPPAGPHRTGGRRG